jgi:hypothetical protein
LEKTGFSPIFPLNLRLQSQNFSFGIASSGLFFPVFAAHGRAAFLDIFGLPISFNLICAPMNLTGTPVGKKGLTPAAQTGKI